MLEPKRAGSARSSYPYVVIRLLPAVYRIVPVTRELAPGELQEEARRYASCTDVRCCVVLGERACVYVEPDGSSRGSAQLPEGGVRLSMAEEEWVAATAGEKRP